MQPITVPALAAVERRAGAAAAGLDSPACRLLTPYRVTADVRRSKGGPMNGTDDAEQISAFLASAARGPAALLIEGEAGIGRTTAWLAAAEEARSAGFRVLSARASSYEREFAFGIASLLIGDVEPDVLSSLPEMQRMAAERSLLQLHEAHSSHDQRAVVAAFTAIVNKLADASPVLVAIDDIQWLDAASRDLLAFAGRRLRGRIGLLLTERTTVDGVGPWLKLGSPDALGRMRVSPMDPSRLQRLVVDRVGRSFSRPTMARIAEVSHGNPFYALELARAVGNPSLGPTATLPPALAEVVRLRIGHLDDEVKRVLLAAACVSAPTVDAVSAMTSTSVDELVQLLEVPEADGVVTIHGNRIRYTHPLLAYGVYSQALPADRRRMHRILADLESAPEQRARHLALSLVSADAETLLELDAAATTIDALGDPAAAAELTEMAIGLGGDTPARRLQAALHHLTSGELDRCRVLAESTAAVLPAGALRVDAWMLISATLMCRGDFDAATETLQRAMADASKRPELQLRVHLCGAMAQSSLGNGDAAQRHCLQAITHAEQLNAPHLLSQALTVHAALQCRRGLGLDRSSLDRAMALEDDVVTTPATFSARVIDALALGWTGRLAESKSKLVVLLEKAAARGAEPDMQWLQFHASMVDIWLGRYADAAGMAEEMHLRAEQIGGTHVRVLASVPAALAAAYTGREDDARKEVEGALADRSAPDGQWTTPWPAMALGFLEVSLGNYAEALNTLQPLLSRWQRAVDTDIATHFVIPDAVEAMIAVNDLDRAEELVATLERNGERLRHPWMSAIGARCRSMMLAARGDLEGAEQAALRAMAEHDGLAAPFERARTQLFLGQLQRRMRHRQDARTTIQAALSTFDELGTSIWVVRAAAELARIHLLRGNESELTASEQRVAELAAMGMTNKDVAAALFISPKTVESNLGRVYRKLGIRTRVELGRRMNAENIVAEHERSTDGDD